MSSGSVLFSFFMIFSGAALLATLALFAKQPLIVTYITLGALLGPYGMAFVTDTELLHDISQAGIIFLLFLLGLDMQPTHLLHMLRKTAIVGLISSSMFMAAGFGIALLFNFSYIESAVIAATMAYSSTIIGIKLLPVNVLHHKHSGELLVSLLLLQDLLAIVALLLIYNSEQLHNGYQILAYTLLIKLPVLILSAFVYVRFILLPLMTRFDQFHEYLFLLAIGWCLGLSEAAELLNLSGEIGAFIAGISIATSPIAQYIALNLKPLRDFFLILFFFSIGASFNLKLLDDVLWITITLSLVSLLIKPPVFWYCLQKVKEKSEVAWDVGLRLGQNSEFAILIAYVASQQALIGQMASHTIQAVTIITLLVSSYMVVMNLESPLATSEELKQD